MEHFFPHASYRPGQKEAIRKSVEALRTGSIVLLNAPTGSGKSSIMLTASLTLAEEEGLRILLATPRRTQRAMLLEHARAFPGTRGVLIPKREACLLNLPEEDFTRICQRLREARQCPAFEAWRRLGREEQERLSRGDASSAVREGEALGICPAELMYARLRHARILILDYNHLFHPDHAEGVLAKLGITLEKTLVLIDEAHNLPGRVRELARERVTQRMLIRAEREAGKTLEETRRLLATRGGMRGARMRALFTRSVEEEMLLLERVGAERHAEGLPSSAARIALFLHRLAHAREDDLLIRNEEGMQIVPLTARHAGSILRQARASMLVSATLPETIEAELDVRGVWVRTPNPFPRENRLDVIIKGVTTQYAKRHDMHVQKRYANLLRMADQYIPGRIVVFYPSYELMRTLREGITWKKEQFVEDPRGDKQGLLEAYYASEEAMLHAVVQGSYSEGIDFAGEKARAVVLIGLPFDKPDVEVKARIDWYAEAFGEEEAWRIAYEQPAFTRALQAIGRLIRTPEDRGVVIYADERYAWRKYAAYIRTAYEQRVLTLGELPRVLTAFYTNG